MSSAGWMRWVGAAVLAFCVSGAGALEVIGRKPAHLWGGPSSVDNEEAITRAIWAPGIDDGYVPQGVTVANGAVLVSGYRSADPKVGKGPCRVFRVEAATGRITGQFDMPESCGHAGGLAYLGADRLVVADTRMLYLVDMKRAFQDGNVEQATLGTLKLAGKLKGSLIAFKAPYFFIGSSEKDADKANGFYLALDLFESQRGKTVREDMAARQFRIGTDAQGAAFDAQGNLWLTFSNSKFGTLQRVDPTSGEIKAEYSMPIGIEDIGFDEQGQMWSVSEAGSLRWSNWREKFPVLFRMDVRKLK